MTDRLIRIVCLAWLAALPARAEVAGDAVVIGVLNNASGGLSAPAGAGRSSRQMAIGDFGDTVAASRSS